MSEWERLRSKVHLLAPWPHLLAPCTAPHLTLPCVLLSSRPQRMSEWERLRSKVHAQASGPSGVLGRSDSSGSTLPSYTPGVESLSPGLS